MPSSEAPQNICPDGKIEEVTEGTFVATDRIDIFSRTGCGADVRGRRQGQPRVLTVTGPLDKLQLAHALDRAAIARHLADPQPMARGGGESQGSVARREAGLVRNTRFQEQPSARGRPVADERRMQEREANLQSVGPT